MKYNRIDFNAPHVSSLSQNDFIAQNKGIQFAGLKPDVEEQELKKVYELCCEEVEKAKAAPVAQAPDQQAHVHTANEETD